jgi:hypothetical protein
MGFKQNEPSKVDSILSSKLATPEVVKDGKLSTEQETNALTRSLEHSGVKAGWDQLVGGTKYLIGDYADEIPFLEDWGKEVKEAGQRRIKEAPQGEGFAFETGTMVAQMAPMAAAIVAAPFTRGKSLQWIPKTIGMTTTAALTASAGGQAAYEYD